MSVNHRSGKSSNVSTIGKSSCKSTYFSASCIDAKTQLSSNKIPPRSVICFVKTVIFLVASSNFSSEISSNLFNSGTVYSLLTFGAFLIFRALAPNLNVLKVSQSLNGWGEAVIIKQVFELPPKDSESILVSFDSRYGT